MKAAALAALAAFPGAMLLAGAVACGSSGSAGAAAGNASTHVLHGAYVPVGSTAASAELRALVFYSDTGYFSYANNCSGASCRSQGTYVFDGATDLALADDATHATRHLDFKAVESTTSANALIGGLITPVGAPLIDAGPGGADLLTTVLQALLDGILMALLGGGDAGASGSAYCDPIAAVIDCGLQGLSVQGSSGGTCSCGASAPSDAAASDASVTITLPVSTPGCAAPQTIPLVVSNAVATMQVSLGGSAPFTALLDTGSSGIWVKPGVIPAAGGTRSASTLSQTYGAKVSMTGTATTTLVTLGGVTSSMALPVAEITSTSCVAGATCPADVGGDPTQFLFAGVYPVIIGIGMRHPDTVGVSSPMPYLGQNAQHIVSLGAPGATTGSIIVDPSDDQVGAFDDNLTALDPSPNGGFDDRQVPFCFNGFCGTALFDCGESQGILLASSATDFANLGVPNGSTTVPGGTAVDIDVAGVDFGLTVGAPPQVGVDSFRIQATGVSNNLGIVAFRYLDFFYDDAAGVIGAAPKSN
jgi:hypothetical protein